MPSNTPLADPHATILRAVDHQTGDPQPVMVDPSALWTVTVAHGSLSHDAAAAAVDAAREAGHLLRWRDAEGTLRFGLTGDGVDATEYVSRPLFDEADRAALQAVIETEAERADPDTRVIAWCNRRLAQL